MVRRGLVALALLVPLRAAAADLPKDVQRSVQLYEQGRKLVESGECTKAIPLFEESIRYNESIGAHLSIAECRGDNALAAWREYKIAEALAKRKEDDRARYAHDHAAALESRLAMIRVVVPAKGHAYLDDHPLEQTEEAIAVEPGAHRIEIVRGDNTRVSKSLRAIAGETVRVTDEPERVVATPPAVPADPPGADPGSARRVAGIIVGGAGLGLTIAGGVFGFLASSKLDDAKEACPAYPRCAPSAELAARQANDAGETDALLATIGIGVGLTAIAAGAVVYLTAPKTPASGRVTARTGSLAIRF